MQKKNITRLIVGPIATNCWIYHPLDDQKSSAALIDPGAEPDTIISTLKKLSLVPKLIILTHGHFDHIAALSAVAKAFKTDNPVIAIHRLDAEYLGSGSYQTHSVSVAAAVGDTSLIDADWDDPPSPGCLLEEGDSIGPFTVLHVPGHTPGSVALLDNEAKILFSGDTLFNSDYGRTDLPGGSESAIIDSLRRLFALDGTIEVYPGHGSATTIAQEAARGLLNG